MLHVNFNTYNNYVTDSLYQWDLNQDLVISGLNLAVAPEIHFANADMDRAIVKYSTIENGVVTVRIPNSMLQKPFTIKAYVGIHEGETFKVIETIEIPVIAKTKPADYTIEDSDEEIYSFNALEHKLDETLAESLARYDEVNAKYDEAVSAYDSAREDIIEESVSQAARHKLHTYHLRLSDFTASGNTYSIPLTSLGFTAEELAETDDATKQDIPIFFGWDTINGVDITSRDEFCRADFIGVISDDNFTMISVSEILPQTDIYIVVIIGGY